MKLAIFFIPLRLLKHLTLDFSFWDIAKLPKILDNPFNSYYTYALSQPIWQHSLLKAPFHDWILKKVESVNIFLFVCVLDFNVYNNKAKSSELN